MISVGEIVSDPDFAQSFTVMRSASQFVLGGISNQTAPVPMFGTITVASEEELNQVAEADRVQGAMMFHSTSIIYETHADGMPGLSDTICWNGQNYRIVRVWPYVDWGYYKAMGVRMSGQ